MCEVSSTDAQYGKSFVVDAAEEHTATVIWLHGLGDSGKEWTKLASAISVPWAKFVFPTASRQPSTICGEKAKLLAGGANVLGENRGSDHELLV